MGWRHIEDKDVKARKPHRCFLCSESIPVGTTYRQRVGIDEDGPSTMHMHTECEAETKDWDLMDWETFCGGDLERPRLLGRE